MGMKGVAQMICKNNLYLIELNKQREKKGLPPISRRDFCKWAAAGSAALGLSGFVGCVPNGSSGAGSSGGEEAVGGCGEGPTEAGGPNDDYVKQVLGQDSRAEIGVRPGVEIDYYGEVDFRDDLRFTDFSRIGLSNMLVMASVYHNHIQNRNRQYQFEVHGHERTADAESKIWGRTLVPVIHKMMTNVMNIKGRNLEAFMKQLQVEENMIPSEEHYDVYFEMPTRRRGLITANQCTIAQQYKDAGREDELAEICQARCGNYFQNAAKKYNKNIVVKNLVMPPRQSENHICCKWELFYEADGSQYDAETDLLIDPDKMDKRGELVVKRNRALDDYSGRFRADLRLTDFSREQLARMFLSYHRYDLSMIIGYQTYEMMQESVSAGAAMQVVVWAEDLAHAARNTMMKYMKTDGSGIVDFLKALQVDITAQPPNFENEFRMPSSGEGEYTFHKCFGLTMQEPISTDEQIDEMCALDPPAIGNSCTEAMYGQGPNIPAGKKMHLDIIQMPPRTYTDAACCRWKFTYVDK